MIALGLYELFELFFGLLFFWVAIYILARNPYSKLSWTTFGILFCWSVIIGTDPIRINTKTLEDFMFWQYVLNLPLFIGAVLFYHNSHLIAKNNGSRKFILYLGYALTFIFYFMSLKTDLIFKRIIFTTDFRFNSVLGAGRLFWLVMLFVYFYLLSSFLNYCNASKQNKSLIFPAIATLSCLFVGTTKAVSYYYNIPFINLLFNIEVALVPVLLLYAVVKYNALIPSENIFDRQFLYRTLGVSLVLWLYVALFTYFNVPLTLSMLVFLVLLLALVLITHSFYDWLITFINDLVYNPAKGFSVVNDEEVYNVLKNFNQPERLESSSLMRLKLIGNKLRDNNKLTPVDALQELIREAIDHFAPKKEEKRRIKQNLKHHLLGMMTYDEAEEGQILWELGFEYYPVKIMAQERRYRSPLFEAESPADYTYTSRNAFLALKKEAIHDITWRISYLEKNNK